MTAIAVTSGDLANGCPWPSGNPVARAARRAVPGAWFVTAGLRSLEITGQDGTREYRLPAWVTAALAGWYARPGDVRPFRFTLTEADLVARLAPPRTLLAPPAPPGPVTVLAVQQPARQPSAMRGGPRCGQPMGWRGEKRCGRPAGHTPGLHLSEAACDRRAQSQALARAGGAA